MQSKGDKRNIDIQKAADTVMIIFLDALLFPVDIPSITIYKYAKISVSYTHLTLPTKRIV